MNERPVVTLTATSNRLNALIEKASSSSNDLPDGYIEALIHGVIFLKGDIECLVFDPIYRKSVAEEYVLKIDVPIIELVDASI